jgi:hypothetical protein
MSRGADKDKAGAKTTQSEEKGGKNMRAQDDMKAGSKGEKSAQDSNMKGEKSKSMSSETTGTKGDKNMKAEGREGRDKNMKAEGREGRDKDMKAEGREGKTGSTNAETKSGMSPDSKTGTSAQTKGTESKSQTTGNAATSATAAPPPEKRTQIVSAFKSERIDEVKDVNFNISVGAVVPSSVRFHPIPLRIVEIYPEWRGYEVIYVHGRYIIVRPRTHEIVYIIES